MVDNNYLNIFKYFVGMILSAPNTKKWHLPDVDRDANLPDSVIAILYAHIKMSC